MLRKLPVLLLVIPLVLMMSCSKDNAGAAVPTATVLQAPTVVSSSSEAAIQGSVRVDFTGAPKELDPIEATFSVEPGSTGWDAVKMALGEDNLSFQDYGGDLGIFISGFKGVDAEGNHFWELKINGESAQVGVAKYEVQPGDVLEFVYSSY